MQRELRWLHGSCAFLFYMMWDGLKPYLVSILSMKIPVWHSFSRKGRREEATQALNKLGTREVSSLLLLKFEKGIGIGTGCIRLPYILMAGEALYSSRYKGNYSTQNVRKHLRSPRRRRLRALIQMAQKLSRPRSHSEGSGCGIVCWICCMFQS